MVMARRRTGLQFTIIEGLEERVALSTLGAAHPTLTAAVVARPTVRTTSLPVTAKLPLGGTYYLGPATNLMGPNTLLIPQTAITAGPFFQMGFTQVQGAISVNQSAPSGTPQTSGTLAFSGPKGKISLDLEGPAINFNNGPIGVLLATSRVNYTFTGGTGTFAHVTGTGRLDVATVGFFFLGGPAPGETSQGNVDLTLMPDLKSRNVPMAIRLSGSTPLTLRTETIPTNPSGTATVDLVGGSGSLGSLGHVTFSGIMDSGTQPSGAPETTALLTVSNAKGTLTLALGSIDTPSLITQLPRQYQVTIIDSTGNYAGAVGSGTAMLAQNGSQLALKFQPAAH
jgi:hypothetical protein